MDSNQGEAGTGKVSGSGKLVGRTVCWVPGCRCTDNLKGIPTANVPTCRFILEHEYNLPSEKAAKLPVDESNNKLCAEHLERLPEQPIIGVRVAVRDGGNAVKGTVAAETTRRFKRLLTWRVDFDEDALPVAFMSAEEIEDAAAWRAAFEAAVHSAVTEERAAAAKMSHSMSQRQIAQGCEATVVSMRYSLSHFALPLPTTPRAPRRLLITTAGGASSA